MKPGCAARQAAKSPERFLLEILGEIVWVLVLVQFDVGVEVLEGIRGETADLSLYDVGR